MKTDGVYVIKFSTDVDQYVDNFLHKEIPAKFRASNGDGELLAELSQSPV